MTVCVVGQGGREHALALALSRTTDVVVTPGNPGMAAPDGAFPGGYPIAVSGAAPEQIPAELVVIGPELVGAQAATRTNWSRPGPTPTSLMGTPIWSARKAM